MSSAPIGDGSDQSAMDPAGAGFRGGQDLFAAEFDLLLYGLTTRAWKGPLSKTQSRKTNAGPQQSELHVL